MSICIDHIVHNKFCFVGNLTIQTKSNLTILTSNALIKIKKLKRLPENLVHKANLQLINCPLYSAVVVRIARISP